MSETRCNHTGLTKPECSCVECVTDLLREHAAQSAAQWKNSNTGEVIDLDAERERRRMPEVIEVPTHCWFVAVWKREKADNADLTLVGEWWGETPEEALGWAAAGVNFDDESEMTFDVRYDVNHHDAGN